MSMNYQLESSHVADYQLYRLAGVGFPQRGPQWPLEATTPCVSFLGAAQTFGAFCKYPFASLLGEMCSTRVLNFGRGGAGPGFFTARPAILELVNRSEVCVLQVMSARSSVENSHMTSVEGLATVRLTKGPDAGAEMLGHVAYDRLAEVLPRREFFELVMETRRIYIAQVQELAGLITVPKILIYVGRHAPLPAQTDPESWTNKSLIGIHPHMVSQDMLEALSPSFDAMVICYGAGGFQARLVNRFTGDYLSIKRSETYTMTRHDAYISPQLHVRAALALVEPVQAALSRKGAEP